MTLDPTTIEAAIAQVIVLLGAVGALFKQRQTAKAKLAELENAHEEKLAVLTAETEQAKSAATAAIVSQYQILVQDLRVELGRLSSRVEHLEGQVSTLQSENATLKGLLK